MDWHLKNLGANVVVVSPLEFMQRLATQVLRTATALSDDRFTALNLADQMPIGLGR